MSAIMQSLEQLRQDAEAGLAEARRAKPPKTGIGDCWDGKAA